MDMLTAKIAAELAKKIVSSPSEEQINAAVDDYLSKHHVVPPPPDGDQLGGITQQERDDIAKNKDDMSAVNNSDKTAAAGQVWTATADGAEWKTPTGGGCEPLELIRHVVINERVLNLMVNRDDNGNAFELDRVNIRIKAPKGSGLAMNGGLLNTNGLEAASWRFNQFGHTSYNMEHYISFMSKKSGFVFGVIESEAIGTASLYSTNRFYATSIDKVNTVAGLKLGDQYVEVGTEIDIWGHRV